jgi:peptidoglycan/xylan/chitin deacetylase (PgdA/CDA1 family)
MRRSRYVCFPSWSSGRLGWFLLCAGFCIVLAGCGARTASGAGEVAAPTATSAVSPTPTPLVTAAPAASRRPVGTPLTVEEPRTLLSPHNPTGGQQRLPQATLAADAANVPFLMAVATAEAGSGAPIIGTSLLPVATPTPATSAVAVGQRAGEVIASTPEDATPLAILDALQQPLPPSDAALPSDGGATPPMPLFLPTPDGASRSARVPILMYHYLSVPPADANIYRQDLSVTPALFAAHLDGIRSAGYTTISLYQLLDHLQVGAPLPEKPVIISFDDGYRDNYENAFPLLQERGMVATFFVVTDFVDEQRSAYMTWDMLREMHAAGMSIESHGRNHASLKNRDVDYLVWQALGSLETIEFELGVRPRFAAYPAGEFDQLTIELFRSANYWAAVTTMQGSTHSNDKLFELRRVRMRGSTTVNELLRLLALDW